MKKRISNKEMEQAAAVVRQSMLETIERLRIAAKLSHIADMENNGKRMPTGI